jgi:hypothetical protein
LDYHPIGPIGPIPLFTDLPGSENLCKALQENQKMRLLMVDSGLAWGLLRFSVGLGSYQDFLRFYGLSRSWFTDRST